ncbi:MAG: AraC family transcriptional regulator [Defluviitaleaceae bacterium]|nr:AraC family transcriptional regulator [Defluviitaleaceae bacterium]
MDWIRQLNQAIAYMEAHMTEDIDYAQVAKIACCSSYHFQRMFTYIAGVPLSEYIRRRKMSLAAVDLQMDDAKIIDIALKYGYASPTAFNRAFQSIHGIAPSRAKAAGALLKSYPALSFKLTIKGVEEMEFRIEKKDAIRLLGVGVPIDSNMDAMEADKATEALWQKVLEEGAPRDAQGELLGMGALHQELNAAHDTTQPTLNGFFDMEVVHSDGIGEHVIAVASALPASGSLKEYIIPGHTWAVFPRENFFTEDYATWEADVAFEERLYSEWLPTSGYEPGEDIGIAFIPATDDLIGAPFELWVPVTKPNKQ